MIEKYSYQLAPDNPYISAILSIVTKQKDSNIATPVVLTKETSSA